MGAAWKAYRDGPRTSLGLDFQGLRKRLHRPPVGTARLLEIIRELEGLIKSGCLGQGERTAFQDWLDVCRAIQGEAEDVEADGCAWLHGIYQSTLRNATERSKCIRASMEGGESGGGMLEPMRDAADSLMDWVANHPPDVAAEGAPTHTEPRYLFRDEGAVFRVRFDGEAGTIDAKLRGADYLYELLQHPNHSYSATELSGVVEWKDNGQADEDANRKLLRVCHRQLAEINAGLSRLDRDAPAAERDELEREKERILAEVKKLTGLGGKVRRQNANRSTQVAVSSAIRRVLEKCRTDYGLMKFAKHVETHVDFGASLSYRPADPTPNWGV